MNNGGVSAQAADGTGERLRCASVLKPLLLWVASDGIYRDAEGWARAAEPAVVVSANDPVSALWRRAGADRLLAALQERTDREWPLDDGPNRGFGRVLVTAEDVAAGYAALARAGRDGDEAATRLLGWMREVPERQTFGARGAAAAALGVPEAAVAVKCGWYVASDETRLRTHAVTVTELDDGTIAGSAVLTAVHMPAVRRMAYAKRYVHGDEVLDDHEELAGELLAGATHAALSGRGRAASFRG